MAAESPTKAPYKIRKRGDKYAVVNNGNEVKALFADRDKAIAYLRALYANVPGAAKRAAKTKWTGNQKRRVKAAADSGPWTTRELWHAAAQRGYQLIDVDLPAEEPDDLDAAIMALLDATFTTLEDMGVEVLSVELQRALDLVLVGAPICDKILALLGVDDDNHDEDAMTEAATASSSKPHGEVAYADPGYQRDNKKRYPIDSADRVRSAWSSITQTGIASKYRAQQREAIKARIRTAAKAFKVELAESAMTIGETLDANAQLHFDQALAKAMAVAIESATVSPEDKTPRGQHRVVKPSHVKDALSGSADWAGMCMACGRPETDPDHDGDMDNPGQSDDNRKTPVAASEEATTPTVVTTIPSASSGLLWNGGLPVNQLYPMYSYTLGSSTAGAINITPPTISGFIQVNDRAAAQEILRAVEGKPYTPEVEPTKAFVTELNGKTLLTGPASTFTPYWEQALTPNEQMLWMQGRFVGAEKANRNGAFWSTADLELGEATVKYGPLNWLHEAKHVIGTIADTRLVAHDNAKDLPLDEPFIEAASVIWRWVYPDEASVVEMASDSGKLWYSMECISKNVECVGDGGCGRTVAYMDYVTGEQACEHMRQRSATRRFANPTFLGGAVIMPPARPGWAEADAQVMRTAASLAEKAFDQAGHPDIPASDWELLMAQVVRFAG